MFFLDLMKLKIKGHTYYSHNTIFTQNIEKLKMRKCVLVPKERLFSHVPIKLFIIILILQVYTTK